MICMNYDHNKKFGLLKFYSGYWKINLNSPKGYGLKIINAQTDGNVFWFTGIFFPKVKMFRFLLNVKVTLNV